MALSGRKAKSWFMDGNHWFSLRLKDYDREALEPLLAQVKVQFPRIEAIVSRWTPEGWGAK